MILETTETRWFWVTDNLSALIAWFAGETVDITKELETRIDEYLILPGNQTTGIKIRAGRLEVKALVADEGPHKFHESLTGRIQRWVKWSLEDPVVKNASDIDRSEWQKVEKSRLLRRYSWIGEPIELKSEQANYESNCHLELTSVSLKPSSKAWVTFGIESYGTDLDQITVLRQTAQYFFLRKSNLPEEILHSVSLSYPEWLVTLE